MKYTQRALFTIARSPLAGMFISWVFAHVSFIIPVRRLRETETLLAFHHPRPSYPLHILLVPKRAIKSVMAIESSDADFLLDLFQVVQSLVVEFNLEQTGYSLIVNGGPYQEASHLHFHLFTRYQDSQGGGE